MSLISSLVMAAVFTYPGLRALENTTGLLRMGTAENERSYGGPPRRTYPCANRDGRYYPEPREGSGRTPPNTQSLGGRRQWRGGTAEAREH